MRLLLSFLLLWPAYSQACYIVGGLNELQFGVYDPGSASTPRKKVTLRVECTNPGGVKVDFDWGKNLQSSGSRAMAGGSFPSGAPQMLRYNLYKTEGAVLGSGDAGLSFNVGKGDGRSAKGQADFWAWIAPQQQVGTGYYWDAVQVTISF